MKIWRQKYVGVICLSASKFQQKPEATAAKKLRYHFLTASALFTFHLAFVINTSGGWAQSSRQMTTCQITTRWRTTCQITTRLWTTRQTTTHQRTTHSRTTCQKTPPNDNSPNDNSPSVTVSKSKLIKVSTIPLIQSRDTFLNVNAYLFGAHFFPAVRYLTRMAG